MSLQETLELSLAVEVSRDDKKQFGRHVKTGDYFLQKHSSATHAMSQLDDALNAYARALELMPDNLLTQAKVASVWVKKGNYTRAAQLAKQVLKRDSKQSLANYVLGYIAYKSKRPEQALPFLWSAVCYGGFKAGKSRLCLSYTYRLLAKQGTTGFSEFQNTISSAYFIATGFVLQPFEENSTKLLNLAVILPALFGAHVKERHQDFDGVLEDLLALYEKFPGLPSLQTMIGGVYNSKNQSEDAIYWFRKALFRDPANEEALRQTAQLLEEREDYEGAVTYYDKLLAIKPNCPDTHCALGNIYYMNGNFEETVRHYRAAFQSSNDPKWKALVSQSLAKLYIEHLSDPEAAKAVLTLAIELQPEDIENYTQLGLLFFESNDFMNAELMYERAIRIAPENAVLYSSLGYLKWMNDDLDAATELYERAIALDPLYDVPCNNLGVIEMDSRGNFARAIELFEHSVELNENYALAYYNLGRAYSFYGRKIEAASYFKKAQTLNEMTHELDNNELEEQIYNLFNSPQG